MTHTPEEVLQLARAAGWVTMFQQWDEETCYGKPALFIAPQGACLPPKYRGCRWTLQEMTAELRSHGHLKRTET